MHDPTKALAVAVGCFASQAAFAAALSQAGKPVTSQAVGQWRRALAAGNPKGIPQDRCEPIETATGGRVRVEALRPDLLWKRDPDGRVVGVTTPIRPTARKRAKRRTAQ